MDEDTGLVVEPAALRAAAARVRAAGRGVRQATEALVAALASPGADRARAGWPGERSRVAAGALAGRWRSIGADRAAALDACADALLATAADIAGTDAATAADTPAPLGGPR